MNPTDANESEDRLRALFQLTGRRPAVPVERAGRVKATVRAYWRTEVGRRVRRRRVAVLTVFASAAVVITVLGLAAWWRGIPRPLGEPAARIEIVSGDSAAAFRPGAVVIVGAELATEAHGRLALRLASGSSVRLDAGTRVRVLSGRALALDRGAVYVDSARPDSSSAEAIEIVTPLGSIRDTGTQFEVRVIDASVRVRVREGSVVLDRTEGRLNVSAGHELAVHPDGVTDGRDLAAFGTDWAWLAEITPMLDLEGRSLREFLDWVARERGLRLQFASPELAASASRIALNGSIQGMSLDQALLSVLPTCGMTSRTQGDLLILEK